MTEALLVLSVLAIVLALVAFIVRTLARATNDVQLSWTRFFPFIARATPKGLDLRRATTALERIGKLARALAFVVDHLPTVADEKVRRWAISVCLNLEEWYDSSRGAKVTATLCMMRKGVLQVVGTGGADGADPASSSEIIQPPEPALYQHLVQSKRMVHLLPGDSTLRSQFEFGSIACGVWRPLLHGRDNDVVVGVIAVTSLTAVEIDAADKEVLSRFGDLAIVGQKLFEASAPG